MNNYARPKRFLILIAPFFLTIGIVLVLARMLEASSWTTSKASPASDVCFATFDDGLTEFTSKDAGALQDAVNASSPGDMIKVAGSCAGVQHQGGVTQTVYISKSITIQGGYTNTNWLAAPDPGAFSTTLNAEGNGRVIYVEGATDGVTLAGLILTGGNSSESGGGVYCDSCDLTISEASLIGNTADIMGGGIGSYGGKLTVTESTFMDNSAFYGGGMASGEGKLTVTNSTIMGNRADFAGGLASSGGNLVVADSSFNNNWARLIAGGIGSLFGTSLIIDSTLSDNAAGEGGGIVTLEDGSTIINCTISGNTAVSSTEGLGGGGIISIDSIMTITFGTITSNTATAFEGKDGIVLSGTSTLLLSNSIVADNGGSAPDAANCNSPGGAITDGGYNLDNANTCGLTSTTSLTKTMPLLGPLVDNGGKTFTHALLFGSPAIDRIPLLTNGCGTEINHDQRGEPRPHLSSCDIGAFEYQGIIFRKHFPLVLRINGS